MNKRKIRLKPTEDISIPNIQVKLMNESCEQALREYIIRRDYLEREEKYGND